MSTPSPEDAEGVDRGDDLNEGVEAATYASDAMYGLYSTPNNSSTGRTFRLLLGERDLCHQSWREKGLMSTLSAEDAEGVDRRDDLNEGVQAATYQYARATMNGLDSHGASEDHLHRNNNGTR